MAKFTAFIVSGIDGIIATGKAKLPEWASREDQEFFKKSLRGFDAFVMGRNTYIATEGLPRRENTFVLTDQIKSTKKQVKVTFVNPQSTDLKTLLSKFKRVAVLGGGQTYQYMLDNKMIDEIFLTVEPIILGEGVRMFADKTIAVKLKLLSAKKLNAGGTMLLHYRVEQ